MYYDRDTKRPLNQCGSCGYTWYPRGKDVSLRCPRCANQSVHAWGNASANYNPPNAWLMRFLSAIIIGGACLTIWMFNDLATGLVSGVLWLFGKRIEYGMLRLILLTPWVVGGIAFAWYWIKPYYLFRTWRD